MTHTPTHRPRSEGAESLALRSPDAVLAALPYLLGFTPQESLVLVWIGRRRLLLTQRLDLVGARLDPVRWRAAIWEHAVARCADELIAVLVTDDPEPDDVAADVRDRAALAGVGLRDLIVTREGRWRSLLCNDPSCCPSDGRPVDPSAASAMAAEFTLRGVAPMPDRAALVRELSEDARRSAAMRPLVDDEGARIPGSGRSLEDWRDATIDALSRTLGLTSAQLGPPVSPEESAQLIVGLGDVRVRDTLLWECASSEQVDLDRTLAILVGILPSAPSDHIAPVATACAVVAWLAGDGARALIAVERALLDAPEYTLAMLVLQSLRAGLPPSTWREAMSSVDRAECRYGLAAGRRATG